MSEHLTQKQIEEYRARRLTPDALEEADAHLETCDACARRLTPPAQERAAMQTLSPFLAPQSAHLPYERQEKYVNGEAGEAERRAVEAHLRDCASCREDVEDLRAFRLALLHDGASQIAAPPAPTRKAAIAVPWSAVFRAGSLSLASAAAAGVLVWLTLLHPSASDRAALEAANRNLTREAAAQKTEMARVRSEQEKAQAEARTAQAHIAEQQRLNTELARKNGVALQAAAEFQRRYAALDRKNRQIALANEPGPMDLRIPPDLLAAGGRSVVRGDGFGPKSPVNAVTLSEQPTLKWNPLPDAKGYQITVYTPDGKPVDGAKAVVDGDTLSWRLTKPLSRGETYYWKVVATIAGQGGEKFVTPSGDPQPRFRVLERQKLSGVLKAQLRNAALLWKNGLYEEAETSLKEIAPEAVASKSSDAPPESREAQRRLDAIEKLRGE